MTVRLIIGDVRDVLAALPDGSVDAIVTSPPFLALRSYLPADHPDKALEIGSEATPAEFLDVMLALTAEFRRVLAPHGSIAVELGDTYAGSGGAGGDYNKGGLREGQAKFDGTALRHRKNKVLRADGNRMQQDPGWPLDKSLCFIPSLYGASLAYGRNLLTGVESPVGRWRVRNLIAWCRPNPPVGALGDKFRPATSFITVACTARDRWFDLEELRTPHVNPRPQDTNGEKAEAAADLGIGRFTKRTVDPAGAPPLDWWNIPTQPYRGSHYATFSEEIPRRLILAMCPLEVCVACGKPRRRIVKATEWDRRPHPLEAEGVNAGGAGSHGDRRANPITLGWTDCGCGAGFRPGIVLDPFAGSGTTLAVAQALGRDAIGIDLDERNADLCRERVGMFLEVEHRERAA